MADAEVGTAYVSIIPSARGFAKKLKGELARELASADFDDLLTKAFGGKPMKLPVKPEVDPKSLPDKLPTTKKLPKLPVTVDPLMQAFQADVKRQVGALARQVNAEIPVGADTDGLRAELAAELSAIQGQLKAEIPTEPGELREYEAKLRAAVERAESRVKANVKVDVDAPGIDALPSKFQGVAGAMASAAGTAATLGGALSGPVGAAGALAAAIAGLGAAVAIGVPALSALAGAAAALPGAFAGAAAAIGTLSLGFKGISDAFKPASGGGGGGGGEDAASRARRIAGAERAVEAARRGIAAATRGLADAQRGLAQAERNVADAVQRSLRAQQAVNRARKEAAEDLEDLDRALRGARISEAEAAQDVLDAQLALDEARQTGNIPDIIRAQNAYERAKLTLEESKDTTEDLTEAQADAAKKGVEGSDKVQDALRDQVDAQRAVQDAQEGVLDAQNAVLSANDALKSSYDGLASAQDSLAEAQKRMGGGGGGGIADVVKLAPEARKFVEAVKDLGPAFEDLRLDVQNRLFRDLDTTVTNLGNAWIPALKTTLGRYADTFNTFFRTLGATLTQPEIITKLQEGAEGARKGLEAIGTAISGPLVEAFAALASASAPFLQTLGEKIGEIVTRFSEWVLAGERSGALQEFFTNAAAALEDIFDIGIEVGRIIGNVFEIITGKDLSGGGKTPLESFRDGLAAIADYLDNPANQQQIRDFIQGIQESLTKAGEISEKVEKFYQRMRSIFGGGDGNSTLGQELGAALVTGIVVGIGAAARANFENIAGIAQSIINWIKDVLGIHSPSTVMIGVGKEIVNGLVKGIGDKLVALAQKVAQIPGRVRSAIGRATSILYTHGQNIVIGLANGVLSYFNRLTTWVRSLRGAVTNAFTTAGSWLYNIGRTIVQGLMNGISSMFGRLGSFLGGVGTFIQNNKGPIEKDRKLLIPAGQAIMQGLVEGIASRKGELGSELGSVTGMFDAIGAVANPAPGMSSTYGPGQLQVVINGNGDWLMDGLRRNITVRYNGDPIAALGS